jgi:hypothetical protein
MCRPDMETYWGWQDSSNPDLLPCCPLMSLLLNRVLLLIGRVVAEATDPFVGTRHEGRGGVVQRRHVPPQAANFKACARYGWTNTDRYADPGRSVYQFVTRVREN